MKIVEGYMPYLGYQTYYRVVGENVGNKKPILLLHGGPGSTHNYFEMLDDIAKDGRAVIMYDQLGCGLSAIPESKPDLWKSSTWINELIALREHLGLDEIHVLGQSWGGMLAIEYLCDHAPKGIKSVILSSTLPSSKLWAKEQHRLITLMDEKDQAAIKKAEETETFDAPAYLEANDRFLVRFAMDAPGPDLPEPLRRKKIPGSESYLYAWGPNEYNPTGSLANWDYTDKIKNLRLPTLVTSGYTDLCTPLIAKTIYDSIPDAKWELFEYSRHMPFVDENQKYQAILTEWLNKHD